MQDFSQIAYDEFTRFSVLKIVFENYYQEQLAKLSFDSYVKYLTDACHRHILSRFSLPSPLRNLNSDDYHGDSVNVMFPRFPDRFLAFPSLFLRFL